MTFSEFEKFYKNTAEEAWAIQKVKQEHYGNPQDVFESIREISTISGLPLSKVTLVLFTKHIASVKKLVYEYENDPDNLMIVDMMKEKVEDIINYSIFLKAIIDNNE